MSTSAHQRSRGALTGLEAGAWDRSRKFGAIEDEAAMRDEAIATIPLGDFINSRKSRHRGWRLQARVA
jgi:hypothetical protein